MTGSNRQNWELEFRWDVRPKMEVLYLHVAMKKRFQPFNRKYKQSLEMSIKLIGQKLIVIGSKSSELIDSRQTE